MVAVTTEQTYSMVEVAAAAEMQLNTLRTWIKRGNIAIVRSEIKKHGKAHRLNYRTVVRIAITWEFVKLGTAPERAWTAALRFTVTGNASRGRGPGELWKEGQTYLILAHSKEPELLNLADDAPASRLTHYSQAAIVIHMNPFIAGLQKRLAALRVKEEAKAA
jgi:hypothetical protein